MSYTNMLVGVVVLMLVSDAISFYVGRRGFTGVKSDLQDAKEEINKLKARIQK